MTTTYMLLALPTPSTTIGPDWAQQLITALEAIDAHDHSSDKGTKVTPAGILINADLDFDNNKVTALKGADLQSQASTTSVAGQIYRVGNSLYFNNSSGTPIQITSGTSVNAPGSGSWNVTTPGSYPYTVVTGDAQRMILVDSSGGARTINLLAATNVVACIIKDQDGQAQTNNITISPNGTDTIDGTNADITITDNYGAVGLISDGTSAWYRF